MSPCFPPPKQRLPQQLKRSSLTAVIKSWRKTWCAALAPKFPKSCSLRSLVGHMLTAVSEVACASDALAEPGLGKPSYKQLGCCKVKHLSSFPLSFFPSHFPHKQWQLLQACVCHRMRTHCKNNVSCRANRFFKVLFFAGQGFLTVLGSCFQRFHLKCHPGSNAHTLNRAMSFPPFLT